MWLDLTDNVQASLVETDLTSTGTDDSHCTGRVVLRFPFDNMVVFIAPNIAWMAVVANQQHVQSGWVIDIHIAGIG